MQMIATFFSENQQNKKTLNENQRPKRLNVTYVGINVRSLR